MQFEEEFCSTTVVLIDIVINTENLELGLRGFLSLVKLHWNSAVWKLKCSTNPHVFETTWVGRHFGCFVLWFGCCKMSDDDRDIDIESDVSL
jgi:hypothetical protein